jgi:hypothetical protein
VRGQITDSKPNKTVATTVLIEVADGSRNRDLRHPQIAEIRKLLLRAAELQDTKASREDIVDLAV